VSVLGRDTKTRRPCFVRALFACAFLSAVSGCSAFTNPIFTKHTGLAGIHMVPQSLGNWSIKRPAPTVRAALAAATVDGILYAIGGAIGSHSHPVNTLEAYDHPMNSWTPQSPMPTARSGLAVGVINGIQYAVGGLNQLDLNKVEAYNPTTDTWTTKAPMPTARWERASGAIGGKLYAAGGFTSVGASDVVEAYDPSTNSWTTKASMPHPRFDLAT